MKNIALYLMGLVLLGEGVVIKILIDSHNRQIDAIVDKGNTPIRYYHYMGIRERQEKAQYDKEWDEYWKNHSKA